MLVTSNFVAERGVSEDFWIYFYRKRVSLVSRLLSFLFWLILSPHLLSVPLEEPGELRLFPVLIKDPAHCPGAPRQQQIWGEQSTHLGQEKLDMVISWALSSQIGHSETVVREFRQYLF